MKKFRILLADDHELFCDGLAGLINEQEDMEVVGQARDGLMALQFYRDLQPDLLIMDISMPVCDGLEATRMICERYPEARILMLTIHEEEEKLFEAIKYGACGYLLKNINAAGFLENLRQALAGEAVLPPRLASHLLKEFSRLAKAQPPAGKEETGEELSRRELQVLELVASGRTDKEIAHELCISLHTVKTHVRNILAKLHAINRSHAARLATQRGLIDSQKKGL